LALFLNRVSLFSRGGWATSLADVSVALDCSIAGLHGALDSLSFKILTGFFLQTAQPLAFRLSGDANGVQAKTCFCGTASFSAQPMILGPADMISETYLWDCVRSSLQRG